MSTRKVLNLIFRRFQRKISLEVWKPLAQRYLNKRVCAFHYPDGLGSEKSRLSPPTQGNGGPQPSVRCTHKDNEIVQTGTHSFRISALWRTLLLPYKLRAKNTSAILHISGRCVPYSRVRCVQLALSYSLFEMRFIFNRVVLFNPLCQCGKRPNQSRQQALLLTLCILF